jgi:beta-galactosidase
MDRPESARIARFPDGFVWGTATSSYQIEGGWLEGSKGLSIWDAFTHTPGKIADGTNGDVTTDHFHRYREDVALMAALGLKAYRFSISWPRIQPPGYGKPNPQGLRFYSDLIDELLRSGIEPWVTLYHWDLPLALHLESEGWLNPSIAERFAEYAGICFEHFGDRVKHWITLNEPWVTAILGYGQGFFAPGRTSHEEPYRAGHNLLRAHAMAADLYRRKFQSKQKGVIGLSNNCDWREPRSEAAEDREAAQRSLEFFLGWFADPVHFGTYPDIMRSRVGERLPAFTPRESELLRGSTDFFGLNHYTTMVASHAGAGVPGELNPFGNGGIFEDQDVVLTTDPRWKQTQMGWAIVPWGCRKLLHWVSDRYGKPDIILTENGAAFDDRLVNGQVDDPDRVEFLKSYLLECHRALQENVPLKGYFLWSFMDNFEWASGYTRRFGIHYVDYATGRRIPKASARWYSDVLRKNGIGGDGG